MENIEDGAWIVALVAPWAIAPHPNFSQDTINGPSLLALVSLFRSRDLERYTDLLTPEEDSVVAALIDAANRSVTAGTVRSGAEDLWIISHDPAASVGIRVAAAIFAAVAEVEMDEITNAIEKLTALAPRLCGEGPSPSTGLGIALMYQQIAARTFEIFDYQTALETLDLVHTYLSIDGEWDKFGVSKGIGWDADRVQNDVREAILRNSLELRARIEGFTGSTWAEVIKARPNWPHYRTTATESRRDSNFVTQTFDTAIGARSRGMRWIASDPVISPALEALMVAELSADVNSYMQNRRALGQHRVLQASQDPSTDSSWSVEEALRLFRQSRSKGDLKRTLDWIYLQGPTQALVNDASLILQRQHFPQDVSASDLTVLSSAAPFLAPPMLREALKSSLRFLNHPKGPPGSAPADERTAWIAITKLLPGSEMDQSVAESALESLSECDSLDLIGSDLVRLLETLQWDIIEPATAEKWKQWGRINAHSDAPVELIRRVQDLQSDPAYEEMTTELDGIELALHLVSKKDKIPSISESTLLRAQESCIEGLTRIREDAQKGSFSFGGVDITDLSTIFAKVFCRTELWNAVGDFVTDSAVRRDQKEGALTRMADYGASVVPEDIKSKISSRWASLENSKSIDVFTDPSEEHIFAAAIRLGIVLEVVAKTKALSTITEMASSRSSEERRSACALLLDMAETHDEWVLVQTMLLNLTRDPNPEVRAQSAKTLAIVGRMPTDVSPLVTATLISALESDGIQTPLLTIHGFQKLAGLNALSSYDESVLSVLQSMSVTHKARIIRKAAQLVFAPRDNNSDG